jgi:hypothetical protein
MKKQITLLSGLLLVTSAFGQVRNSLPVMSAKKNTELRTGKIPASNAGSTEKFEGETLWSNNFSSANNWVSTAVNGTVAANFGWQLATAPNQITTWAFPTNTGTFTGGGGYAGVENGNPNAPSTADVDAQWILTYDSIFDFSAVNNLLFEFQEYGALFTDKQAVEVSTDGGATWTEIGNNDDLGMLTAGGGSAFPNPTNRSYNVTAAVGASTSTMKFRFRVHWPAGGASAGIMYGWFVDNVKFVEGYANDVMLQETYSLTGNVGVQYTKFPSSQVTAAATTEFSGIAKNIGSAAQDVTLTVTGPNSYNEASAPLMIAGFDQDSVFIPSAEAYTIPTTLGAGTFTFTLTSNNTLSNTANDVKTAPFEVTNSIMAVDQYTNAASINSSFTGWATASGDPAIGTVVEVFTTEAAGAVHIGIANIGGTQQDEYLGRIVFGQIHKFNTVTEEWDYVGQTEDHEIVPADFGVILPLYLEEAVTLTPGEYLVTAASFQNNEVPIAFSGFVPVGQTAGFNGASVVSLAGNESFEDLVEAAVVRLDFTDYTGIKELTAASDVTVYPNPFVGSTEMEFTLKADAQVSVVITDVAGRTVATVPATTMNAGKQTIAIDGSSFVAGIYNYTLKVGNETITKRIVKK